MKKLVSVLLAVAMVVGFAFTAMADSKEYDTGKETNPDKIPFTCNSISVSATIKSDPSKVRYNVTVDWSSLTFEYDRTGSAWDPSSHTYDNNGKWTSSKIESAITVANHSNAAVSVAATAPSAKDGVTVSVALHQGSSASLVAADTEGIYGVYENAAKAVYDVSVAGTPANNTTFTVGSITVVISAAS